MKTAETICYIFMNVVASSLFFFFVIGITGMLRCKQNGGESIYGLYWCCSAWLIFFLCFFFVLSILGACLYLFVISGHTSRGSVGHPERRSHRSFFVDFVLHATSAVLVLHVCESDRRQKCLDTSRGDTLNTKEQMTQTHETEQRPQGDFPLFAAGCG